MLMYFNFGLRNYPRCPTEEVSLRHNWEFYAILSGEAAPYFSEAEKLLPTTGTLWLIPPRRSYAWWSRTKKAERMVFHFSNVDHSLQLLMGQRDFLSVPINVGDIKRLRVLGEEVQKHYDHLSLVSSLHFNKALAELSLMIARVYGSEEPLYTLTTKYQILAQRARAFFQSQLPRRPLVDEVARTVGVSSTQLRRIFLEVFHEPPKHAFLIAQLEQAKHLAATTDLLISEIAVRSGFRGAPDFCRAFRNYNHTTFHQWRTQIVDLKRWPSAPVETEPSSSVD